MRIPERPGARLLERKGIRWRSWDTSLPHGLDRKVLTEALNTAAGLYDVNGSDALEWLVGAPMRRRSSVLIPLQLVSTTGPIVGAYHKTYHPRYPSRIEALLARTGELTEDLVLLADGEGIAVPRVLAVHPESLTMVITEIPGRPLRSTFVSRLTTRRREVLDRYRRIGKAVRLIEQVGHPDEPVLNAAEWSRVDRALERARGFLSPQACASLRVRLSESFDAAQSGERPVYAHGDLTGTNILLDGNRIGLIDFQWGTRWPGYDLAFLASRIAHDPAIGARWGTALTHALAEGYGDLEIASSPGWVYYTLWQTLRLAIKNQNGSTGRSLGIRRARRQLMSQA